MTLQDWLNNNGLGQYLAVLLDEEIDMDIVMTLDDADLRALGLKMGARKRFLLAAQRLEQPAPPKPPAARSPASTATPTPDSHSGHPRDEHSNTRLAEPAHPPPGEQLTGTTQAVHAAGAERRNLSVMFCDMVGSTALSTEIDIEDYREIVSSFQEQATRTMQEHEGLVARYMGDGLLVYFGYPVAREDDALRAVRAGLALVDAVDALSLTVDVSVRVGIATGSVIVGDNIGHGASEETAVHGEAANLAARLQSAAVPGSVVINAQTCQHLGHAVATTALPPMQLKGFEKPVNAYRALRIRDSHEARARQTDAHAMVGREVELSLLAREWQFVCEGEGRSVLLRGGAGLGKSRLLRAFEATLDADSLTTVEWHCALYHQGTPSFPFAEQLQRALGSGDETTTSVHLNEWLLRHGLEPERYGPALARLIGLAGADDAVLLPEVVKELLLKAQSEWLKRAASAQPILFVVENLHWCDGATREFLELLCESIASLPVLLVMTTRPESTFQTATASSIFTYDLGPLTRAETDTLVRNIAVGEDFPEQTIELIVARAEGLPLFAEALTQEFIAGAPKDGVPPSLQNALTARIDRLGAAKPLLQAAAVVGRDFTRELLQAVAGLSEAETDVGLELLHGMDMVRARRLADAGVYEFNHTMVRDVAYDMMLKATRREFHLRAALALADGHATVSPEVMGHHWSEAGKYQKAAEAFEAAGSDARLQGAHIEAQHHFQRATELATRHGDCLPAWRLQLVTSAAYMMHLNGERNAARELLDEHETIVGKVDNTAIVGRFHCARGEVLSFLGERTSAGTFLGDAMALALRSNDSELEGMAANLQALECLFVGRIRESLTRAEQAITAFRRVDTLAWDTAGALSRALFMCGVSACLLGELDAARAALTSVTDFDLTLNTGGTDNPSLIQAYIGWTAGEWDSALACVQRELDANPSPFNDASLTLYLGRSYLGRGDLEKAITLLEESVEKTERYRSKQIQLWAKRDLGHAYAEMGRWDSAEAMAAICMQGAGDAGLPTTDERLLLGRVKLHTGTLSEARQILEGVLEDYRDTGRKPLEAETLRYMAALEHTAGDNAAARSHLSAAHSIYLSMKAPWFVLTVEQLATRLGVTL